MVKKIPISLPIKKFAYLVAGFVFIFIQSGSTVIALPQEQKNLLNENVLDYDIDECAAQDSAGEEAQTGNVGSYEYIKVGNIPESGMEVGASIYGGSYRGDSWKPSNQQQGSPDGRSSDDIGIGNHDNPLPGTTSYAELSTSAGSLDFSALGDLKNGTKLEITYNGKSIVAEKADVGAGGGDVKGKPRAIDLWWEVVKLMDPEGKSELSNGVDVLKVRGVAPSTPVTPVDGTAVDSSNIGVSGDECYCEGSSNFSGDLPIPEYWKNLILGASDRHSDTDPRTVAAVLHAENRGWPDPNKDWGVSSAGASGPWQFIPSSWDIHKPTHISNPDINNPEHSVHAAFSHLAGTANLPLIKGETGNPESDYSLPFTRDGDTMLSAMASYNGSGAVSGTAVNQQPDNENGDYVRMVYWLVASNFSKTFDTVSRQVVDIDSSGAGGQGTGSLCPSGSGDSTGNFVWPVSEEYGVISCYGTRGGRLHSGIDIAAPSGTEIVAVDGGKVTHAGSSSGFGETVVIEHEDGLSTLYAHQKTGSIVVSTGDEVSQGQKIGEVNNTGSSTGDHLHFNVQTQNIPAYSEDRSDTEDPLDHLPKDGRSISAGSTIDPGPNCK